MPLPDKVSELVDQYRRGRLTFESDSYVEASVRQEFIDPFFRELGWDVGNFLGWADQNKEVVVEPYVDVEGKKKRPDYAFRVGPQEKFFVEAKRPSIVLRNDPESANQIRTYGWNSGMPICVLTNFGEFSVYDTSVKPKQGDRSTTARIDHFTFEDFGERWEWIESLLGRDSVWRGSLEEFAKGQPTRRGTEPVDVAILVEIEKWRETLAQEIARKNLQLPASDLNFAVQSTIDRVMFLRICEDRDVQPYGELRGAANAKDVYGELLRLFKRADARYNSGLFHFEAEFNRPGGPDELTPGLSIGNSVLTNLILDLYPPASPFDFRFVGVEVLGKVYEEFLGRVITVTAGRRIVVDEKPEVKNAGGVVYTPESVVRYIIEKSVKPSLLDQTVAKVSGRNRAKNAHPLRVLDPACGSGSFLIAVYQTLLDWYFNEYLKSPTEHMKGRNPSLRPIGEGSWQLTTAERKRILLEHIYGVDIDPQAVEVTKLSLLLKCLEGESEATIHQQMTFFQQRALPDLDENIRCGNSLISTDFITNEPTITADPARLAHVNMFDWPSEFPDVFEAEQAGFDVVLGNPPYVLLQDQFRDDKQLEFFRANYRSASYKIDTYHLFMEASLRLTRPDGWFSMITPTNYLTNNFLKELRTLLLDESSIESVTIIDGSVFPRRSVDCAVIATRPHIPTSQPFAMLHAIPAPHEMLAIASEGEIDANRVRNTDDRLFTGTADVVLAGALDLMDRASCTLGQIARINFGKQLRDRRMHVDDVISVSSLRAVPPGYAACVTGRDVTRWAVEWSGLALFDNEVARSGGCWDPDIQNAKNKLITRQIGAFPTWGVDTAGHQCLNTVFMALVTDDRYDPMFVLGLLNAAPLRAYWLDRFYDQRTTFPKIKGTFLKKLPIPAPPSDIDQKHIADRVRELMRLRREIERTTSQSEKQRLERGAMGQETLLDKLVAKLYGLDLDQALIAVAKVQLRGSGHSA